MQLEMNRAKDYIVLAFKDRETLMNVFRVCLFGSKIVWMENFGKKMRINFFLSVFGWVGRKKINGGAKCFFPKPTKNFSLKQRKNWKEKLCIIFWRKCSCAINSSTLLLFIPFFFFHSTLLPFFWTLPGFFFDLLVGVASLFLFFFLFFFFSFDLLGRLVQYFIFIFLLSFLFFGFRCDFFLWAWFLFFNKFRWLIFLVVYHFFDFNWTSFLVRVYA